MRFSKPEVSERSAQLWVQRFFGLTAEIVALPGDVDRNFLVHASDGTRSVLKVSHAAAPAAELECQVAVLDHLATTGLAPIVPQVLRARNGESILEVVSPSGESLRLRRVGYLDGTPLASSSVGDGLQREIGSVLGRLDRALEDFDHPGIHRELSWDLRRVLELRSDVGLLDRELRSPVVAALARFESQVLPAAENLQHGAIHNDANDHNLLCVEADDGSQRLTGLIDFGDMVHSFTVAELAIACAYAMLDAPQPWEVAARLRAGYELVRPLTGLESRILPVLIEARLCASLLHSARARRTLPPDPYLTVSERPAKALLLRLTQEPRPK